MKKNISTFILLLIFCYANAQEINNITLTGTVLTADGFPAAGLIVRVDGTIFKTTTSSDGRFTIKGKSGSNSVVIASGIANKETIITVNTTINKDLQVIRIGDKLNNLNEVVVTGQYKPQTLKNAVYRVRTINAEKISKRAATNIQQVLTTEFGFRFANDLTLGTTDVEMMGMSGRNVKILLNGVPLVDRSDLRESLNQVDINTVERIEIVEGPMSVVYGTDALAGVINIITKKAAAQTLNLSAKIQEETVGSEYQAFQKKGIHNKNITASWRGGNWSALVGVSNNEFGGWNVLPKNATSSEVASSTFFKPKNQYLANGKLGFSAKNVNVWYRLDFLNEDIASRGGINPNYTVITQTYNTQRINNQLHADITLNKNATLNVTGGFTNLTRATETSKYDFGTGETTLTNGVGEQDVAKFNATILRSTLQYRLSDIVSVQPGFEFNRDAGSGARIAGAPAINDFAFFASAEIRPSEKIKLKPGVRFIHNSVYDAPLAVPSLNAMLNLSKSVELRLGYGRGFRAPALRELYFDFFDASHAIKGNEDLKAEKSNSFDASLACDVFTEGEFKVRSILSGFYNNFYDRIDYGIDANDPTITTLINISKYKTTGLSFDNNLTFKNLQANVGAAFIGRYNQLTNNTTGEIPSFSWTPEVFTNVSYNIPKLDAALSLYLKFTGTRPNYQIDDLTSTAKLVKVGAFTWSDLMLNKSINKYLTVNAGVKNLFDVTSLSNTASSSGGAHSTGAGNIAYSYGRSYVLGLTANWHK